MLASRAPAGGGYGSLSGPGWVLERKVDGLRGLVVKNGSEVSLWSRNRLRFDRRFPDLMALLAGLPAHSLVMDGEIAAFDGDRSSFQGLQEGNTPRITYVAFDLLFLLGHDLRALPLSDRYGLLVKLLGPTPPTSGEPPVATVELSAHLDGDPGELLGAACRAGWEGLVAKRLAAPYRGGRSPDWVKLKCRARQEFVIGGWTEPSGTRSGLGALLVGHHDSEGRLMYAGRVGTGFSEAVLRSLRTLLSDLETPVPSFADAPAGRGIHWARPQLVAEVEFAEWTRDGRLRHPAFLGLRPDKDPRSVVREPVN